MALPILKNVEAILDSYSPSTPAEPAAAKFVRNAFDHARSFVTGKELLRRDNVSLEFKNDIKNAHSAEKWIEIIDSLAALARRAQEGAFQYSHLCTMLHAARTYIIACLKKDSDTNAIVAAEVERRLALFEEANEPERTARKNGYVPNKSIAGDILLTIADLGDDNAILDASDKKLFYNLEFPPRNAAPTTDYIEGVSEAPAYNVNFPLCYHADYYRKYCERYAITLELDSPSVSSARLSVVSRSSASESLSSASPLSLGSGSTTGALLNEFKLTPVTTPSSEPQPSASIEEPAKERAPSPPPAAVAPVAEPVNSKGKSKKAQGTAETPANDPSTQQQQRKKR